MSIIMNTMPALITPILASLKYAVEQINMDQVLHVYVGGNF